MRRVSAQFVNPDGQHPGTADIGPNYLVTHHADYWYVRRVDEADLDRLLEPLGLTREHLERR